MHLGDILEDRFIIERAVGEGGMGAIYRARDIREDQAAAIKILRGDTEPDTAALRFAREARALSSINHPGIVRYIAHGVTSAGDPYLAMEWVEGEDLSQRLARMGALTVAETIAIARGVAEALGEAHARGVLHRDIKPQNLILPASDVSRVKVADFGIAKLEAQSRTITAKGSFVGTPAYAAPEQVRDEAEACPRVDVFSLGCVLFECLTGRPVFSGESVMAIFAKVLFEEVPHIGDLRRDVPQPLGDLLARMLSKNPGERPADGAAVAAELAGLDLSLGPSTPWPPPALTASEQRVVSVIVARPPATSRSEPTPPGEVVSGVYERLQSIGEPFSAHVERLADGSAIAALVGRGTATDQVAQAARCALALRSAIPDARVAVATGRSVVDKRLPVGDVIDRAVRLLATGDAAPPRGTFEGPRPIRLDDVTASLVAARFNVGGEPGSPELLAERDAEEAGRTLLGQPTPCVGRDQELAMLAGLFGLCVNESVARAVLVTAPPGMGKSRLRYELARRVRRAYAAAGDASPSIWIAQGDPSRAGSPFGLIGQLLRRAAGISESEPLEVRREKLRARVARCVPADHAPDVAALLGEIADAPFPDDASVQLRAARRDPALMREQTQLAWEELLAAESQARPLLLIVEDLHWGDGASVHFVGEALLRMQERPILVLALARPEVRDVFPGLWQNRGIQEMPLANLSRKAGRSLARAVLGGDVPDATIERIVEQGAGNALYLEELIRAVAEGTPLPETLLAIVQSRLEALEPSARQIIRAASVFGARFWTSGVAALVQGSQGAARVDEWLNILTGRELIQRSPRGDLPGEVTYTFRHALIREAAYGMLTERDRAMGHRLAAEWMEQAFAASGSATRFSVIGDHFLRGEAWEEAADYLQRAAVAAMSVHAHREARGHCERALECLSRLPDTEEQRLRRGALLLRYQEASWLNESPERSVSRLHEVERLAGARSGREGQMLLVKARAALGRYHTAQQSYATGYKYLQQTLQTALELGDEELIAAARTNLALINAMQGHWAETSACAVEAFETLARHNDWTSWFMGVGIHGMALAARGRYREGLRVIGRLAPRAEELRSPTATALAHVYALYTYFAAGDMPKMRDAAQASIQAAERSGDGMVTWLGCWMGAWASANLGDHEAAAEGAARAHAVLEQFGGRLFIADWFAATDAGRVLLAGRPEEAVALAEKAIQWARSVEGLYGEAIGQRVLGQALAALDPPRWDEAEPHFAESVRLFSACGAVIERARTDIEWGIVCRARGEHGRARAHFERAAAQLEESDLAFPSHATAA